MSATLTPIPSAGNETLPRTLLEQLPAAAPGIRWRVLYFMRTVDSPVCRSHVLRLTALAATLWKRKVDVIVLAPPRNSGAFEAREWIRDQPFPVMVTHDGHAAAGFRRAAFGTIQQSGTLVVGLDGNILFARRSTVPFKAFDERALLASLREVAGE